MTTWKKYPFLTKKALKEKPHNWLVNSHYDLQKRFKNLRTHFFDTWINEMVNSNIMHVSDLRTLGAIQALHIVTVYCKATNEYVNCKEYYVKGNETAIDRYEHRVDWCNNRFNTIMKTEKVRYFHPIFLF